MIGDMVAFAAGFLFVGAICLGLYLYDKRAYKGVGE